MNSNLAEPFWFNRVKHLALSAWVLLLAAALHPSAAAQRCITVTQPLYAHCANFVRVSDYIEYDSLRIVTTRGGTADFAHRHHDTIRVVPSGGPLQLVVGYWHGGSVFNDTMQAQGIRDRIWEFRCLAVCHPGNDSFPNPWYSDTLSSRVFRFSTNMVLDSAFKRQCPFDTMLIYSGLYFYMYDDSGNNITHLPPHFIQTQGRRRPRRVSFRTPTGEREVFYSPYCIPGLPVNQHYAVWLDFSSSIYQNVRAVRIAVTDLRRINFHGQPVPFGTSVGVGWGMAQIILPH